MSLYRATFNSISLGKSSKLYVNPHKNLGISAKRFPTAYLIPTLQVINNILSQRVKQYQSRVLRSVTSMEEVTQWAGSKLRFSTPEVTPRAHRPYHPLLGTRECK